MPTLERIAPDIGFGTSGVRALVTRLNDRVAYAYTAAFLAYLKASGQLGVTDTLVLAHDLRPSSPAIAAACQAAAGDAGLAVEYAGAIPTPALALRAMALDAPGIMVTGSHIPFDRNGIKFYTPCGEIMKSDEEGMRHVDFDLPRDRFTEDRLIDPQALAIPDAAARRAYLERYLDFFPARMLTGKRIGLYQHSGVARDLLVELFGDLGAEVVPLGRSDQFIPIDTEAVGAEDQARARGWCAAHGLDALVSTDGDADRPLIFDEAGSVLRGDVVGILTALYLGANAVATPVSSNTALERCRRFARIRRTRIGSPYVIEAMRELADEGGLVIGFEANGGFLVGSEIRLGERRLSPLPTRDAVLPMLSLLAMTAERDLPVSALSRLLPERHTASDRLRDVAAARAESLLGGLATDASARGRFFEGIGVPVGVDRTDGLRVTLENGDIVHLRPSGNAPELRCYVEADTPAGAEALLALGLRNTRRALADAPYEERS